MIETGSYVTWTDETGVHVAIVIGFTNAERNMVVVYNRELCEILPVSKLSVYTGEVCREDF